jgi:hypothetical protein
MRYMSFVIPTGDVPPSQELMEAMSRVIERETKAGRLLDTGGLMPIDTATRVTLKKGKLGVTDGPFTEAKEVIGGFAMFEFATREEAVAAAVEFMELHKQFCPGWEGVCEVRQIMPQDAQGRCGAQTAVSSAA